MPVITKCKVYPHLTCDKPEQYCGNCQVFDKALSKWTPEAEEKKLEDLRLSHDN